jgi:hypothetical protein
MRPARYNSRPTLGGVNRTRPLGGCCCSESCVVLTSGSSVTLDQPIYSTVMPPEREGEKGRQGHITEMCVHALVCDWVHIWNPIQWASLFQVGGAATRLVCTPPPPSPINRPAPGELDPDWFPDPIDPESGDRTPKGMKKGCTSEAASFPITSHDPNDPPNPPAFPACWDLRCISFAGDTMTHGEPNKPKYGCGFLDSTDCGGAAMRYGNIAFDGMYLIQSGMADAWANDSETIFGKIIRSGDRIGWFENPHRVRHVILTQHFRVRMKRRTAGDPPRILAPPPWDHYVSPSGKNYYSVGQNINFIGIARIEPKGINAIVAGP